MNLHAPMVFLLALYFSFCPCGIALAALPDQFNVGVTKGFEAIRKYNNGRNVGLSVDQTKFSLDDNAATFTTQILGKEGRLFNLSTIFLRKSKTIEKRVHIKIGDDMQRMARMRFIYVRPLQQPLSQYAFQDGPQAWQIYESTNDIFYYTQVLTPTNQVEVKEWIYAQRPNAEHGSVYEWELESEEFNTFIEMKAGQEEDVVLQRYLKVGNVDAKNHKEHKRIAGVVHKVLKDIYINGEDQIGKILPVNYMNREGLVKKGGLVVKEGNRLVVYVNEPATSYPIIIDPTITSSPYAVEEVWCVH